MGRGAAPNVMISRKTWLGAGLTALAGLAGLFAFGGAQSLTVPDWCGGVKPCPPPCLGAPETASSPEEFVQLARYELGRPFRRAAVPRWTRPVARWTPPHRSFYRPQWRPEPAPSAESLPPGNLTMPPLPDPKNVYAGIAPDKISPATAGALSRVYAPNLTTGRVDVIDPATFQVVDSYFAVPSPQHIVPSWDLQTLWVSGDISYTGGHASVAPIDPNILNPKGSLFLTRPSLAHHCLTREELLWRSGDVLGWIASGKLELRIDKTYPLADAPQAHRDLESRRTAGKLILIP